MSWIILPIHFTYDSGLLLLLVLLLKVLNPVRVDITDAKVHVIVDQHAIVEVVRIHSSFINIFRPQIHGLQIPKV